MVSMTIDERLEALTQSVELIASLQKDNEKLIADLAKTVNKTNETVANQAEYMDDIAKLVMIHQSKLDRIDPS